MASIDGGPRDGARGPFRSPAADAEERRAAVRRATRAVTPAVAHALALQNAAYGPSPLRARHIEALRTGAAAVVTGQQVGLFLGPLYTIYKAASAIRLARALSEECGAPVVPVFWLQTEDHDLPEIATCHVSVGSADTLSLALPADPAERVSIAHRTLPPAVDDLVETLRAAIAHLPAGPEHVARLARHYRAGAGWGAAFAGVLAELFDAEGLVLLDPRDPALALRAAPVHRQALLRAEPIADALAARVAALRSAGRDAPVRVRAGAPLSFFHPQGPRGPRYRLEPGPGGFACVGAGGAWPREELLRALEADPLAFSTSALLRPILQDTLLPTAAYVGGPAEVAYFAQLDPLYAEFRMAPPLVVPRARFRVIDARAERLLARLQVEPADAELPEDDLLARCQASARGHGTGTGTSTSTSASTGTGTSTSTGTGTGTEDTLDLERGLLGPFEAALDALSPRLVAAGPGLDVAVEKARAAVRETVAKLAAKFDKARRHSDAGRVDDVRRLKRLLYPDDTPQERVYGLPSFAARFGERAFIERVLAAADPYDPAPRDLR